jgi:hypothetical protein
MLYEDAPFRLVVRLRVTVARASITADTPYGTVCTFSERGMEKVWRGAEVCS